MWHLLAACLLSLCSIDPLDRLERETLRFSAWEQSYDAPTGASRQAELMRLARLVSTVFGVEIRKGTHDGIAGFVVREARVIVLDSTLSPNAALQVLAHEAGHILQPEGLSKADAEVFADAVAYLVTGDDVHVYGRYLAGSKQGLHVLKTYRREIEWAAKVLRGR